jgi:hypothetical protein
MAIDPLERWNPLSDLYPYQRVMLSHMMAQPPKVVVAPKVDSVTPLNKQGDSLKLLTTDEHPFLDTHA